MSPDTICLSIAVGLFAAVVLLATLFNAKNVHNKHNQDDS